MWRRVVVYGALLGVGTLVLQWLDYQRLAWIHAGEIYVALIALAFLILGVFVGARLFGAAPQPLREGNPEAQAALGISARELVVLHKLAAGGSNKQIAAELHVSPHTVKTHVARLFEKLGANRRTEAVNKARELGLVP